MIITLNIVSKFVNIKLGKTVESYLKYSFSRNILVFTIAWMGTRDIYTSIFMTLVFILCVDYLFHEESSMCILSEGFRDEYISKLESDEDKITDEDIKRAHAIIDKAAQSGKAPTPTGSQSDNVKY